MTTLDIWACDMNIDRCDFIKIDVEGSEVNVLRAWSIFFFVPYAREHFGNSRWF
jgi:hypothetical protein